MLNENVRDILVALLLAAALAFLLWPPRHHAAAGPAHPRGWRAEIADAGAGSSFTKA